MQRPSDAAVLMCHFYSNHYVRLGINRIQWWTIFFSASQKFSFKSRKLLQRGRNVWADVNILDYSHKIAFKTDFHSRVRVSVLYRICEFLFLLKSRIFAASKLLQTRDIFWVIQPLYSLFRRLFISKLFCLFTYGSVCRCALRAFTYRAMYKLEWQHGIWAGSSVK